MRNEVLLVARRDRPVIEYVWEGGGGPDRPMVSALAHRGLGLDFTWGLLKN